MDRNLLLAVILSASVLLIWELLFNAPQREAIEAARRANQEQQAQEQAEDPANAAKATTGRSAAALTQSLEEALAATPERVKIETPTVSGSINLVGGQFDDLILKNYRETLEPDSDNIHILKPKSVKDAQIVEQGWTYNNQSSSGKRWRLTSGSTLTPETPIVLTRSEDSLIFQKKISVDDQYMFTVEQTVTNNSAGAIALQPYALVLQRGIPDEKTGGAILHEGAVGVVAGKLYDTKYNKLAKGKGVDASGVGGWIGITNKYWLAAAIPPQDQEFSIRYRNDNQTEDSEKNPIFRTSYSLDSVVINANQTHTLISQVFAGAKEVDILQAYEKPVEDGGLGILQFDKAVDWGFLNFLTRPIFFVLNFFGDLTGNFGVAILILTLIIKAILFPLANKGYESMTKMKKLQPKLEKLKERHGEDKVKMQQDMMALYKTEGVNPMAGCLPVLVQMPIFFALYKTLFVTLELRHEPFIGWIKDLSAPDPTNLFTLFGLIPWDPTALPLIGTFLGLGILPMLMGAAMWFQMSLSPPPPDPTQRQIMAFLPLIFTFLFAGFAAGLVIYWIWNTVLSVAQQILIMKRNGVDVEWKERFSFLLPKKAALNTPDGIVADTSADIVPEKSSQADKKDD